MSKTNLFKTAWSYFKANIFSSFSDCLKAAWQKAKLTIAMKSGAVNLSFTKKDGTETTRIATIDPHLFTYDSKGTGSNPKADVICFYSLTDNGFRSFRIENLIGFQ